jgi:hypothetical protein
MEEHLELAEQEEQEAEQEEQAEGPAPRPRPSSHNISPHAPCPAPPTPPVPPSSGSPEIVQGREEECSECAPTEVDSDSDSEGGPPRARVPGCAEPSGAEVAEASGAEVAEASSGAEVAEESVFGWVKVPSGGAHPGPWVWQKKFGKEPHRHTFQLNSLSQVHRARDAEQRHVPILGRYMAVDWERDGDGWVARAAVRGCSCGEGTAFAAPAS